MPTNVDILEERVVAAVGLIETLRERVQILERELSTVRAEPPPPPVSHLSHPPDHSLVEELKKLRAERVEIRESIRGLLKELDRVSW